MFRLSFHSKIFALLLLAVAGPVSGQVPGMISYQARIVDDKTGPVNDTRAMVFSIYTQAEGGSAIWTEQQNVTIVNGMVNVLLGSVSPLNSDIFQGSERYLGVKIGTEAEMTPRKRLLAVPYALRAEAATIRISPSGNISSTDVTSAISELDAEKLGFNGGTLNGRLNVYNYSTNDVGVDALSADSAAIQAMNSGSGAPAMVAYNFGDGDGMYSFAETGNALYAHNTSDDIVTIYASASGNTNVLKTSSSCEYPNLYIQNDDGEGIYSYSKNDNALYVVSEGEPSTIAANNNGIGSAIFAFSEGEYPTISVLNGAGGSAIKAYNEGEEPAVSATNNGVGVGIYGYSKGSNGIQARTDSDVDAALYVNNTADGNSIFANGNIYATTKNHNAINIRNISDDYPTVYAKSTGKATAVYGYSTAGTAGHFQSDATDHWAVFINSGNGSSSNPGLKVNGYAIITGDVSTTMLTSAGTALAHTISSPQAEFSFSGSARLSNGEAQVAFAQTWQDCISEAEEYRVLVTPTDMCNGIYCVEKTQSGFRVKELMNGTSNATFDWMVRAVRKGSSTEKTLLAGVGHDVGMEIIEETEQEKEMLEVVARQKALEDKMEEKRKVMEQRQGTSLSSTPQILQQLREVSPAALDTDKMEQRVKQVLEYKEKLKEKAQRK